MVKTFLTAAKLNDLAITGIASLIHFVLDRLLTKKWTSWTYEMGKGGWESPYGTASHFFQLKIWNANVTTSYPTPST